MTTDNQVMIYANGVACCSVCAPKSLTPEQIEAAVNTQNPAGTSNGWRISPDMHFRGGEPNPCDCHDDATRRHFLLNC